MQSSKKPNGLPENIQGVGRIIYAIDLEDIYAGLFAAVYLIRPPLTNINVDWVNVQAKLLADSRLELKRKNTEDGITRKAVEDSSKEVG